MYAPGDAAATSGNVVANEGLMRLGVVSDLVNEVLLVLAAAGRRRRMLEAPG